MYLFKGSRTQKLFPRLSKKNTEKGRKSKSYSINKTSRKLRARLSTSRKNDQAVDYRGVSRETRQAFAVLPCVCLFIKKKEKKKKRERENARSPENVQPSRICWNTLHIYTLLFRRTSL